MMENCKIITRIQRLERFLKKKIHIIIVLVFVLLIIFGLNLCSPIYEFSYWRKLGIPWYENVNNYETIEKRFGPSVKKYDKGKESFFQFENFLYVTGNEKNHFFHRVEVSDEKVSFGKEKIRIGSKREEVEKAYKNVRTIKKLENNEMGFIDGIQETWIIYEFNDANLVSKIIIWNGW